uniref:NADH-ubiquinone oxidoreductase chain 4L n=1 Tax=Planopleura kaempferi TaxID=3381683 RepID=A0A344ALW5_9HEMI|nr:NADH dehydrogenase subunit 4L [Platypleura kaempferi]AWV83363.1 NADH dehydrogenase subunit 4L [Platypleura kaempferi]AWV84481.1 NADH dehydrogenase subunit 4L [Platypleura kaempferi]
MILTLSMLFIFMFMSGVLSLCLNRKHIMMSLLSLELIVLSSFCFLYLILSMMMIDMYMLMMFLIFSVCEGVMGLSCLVKLIRSHGNDCLYSMNLKTC